MEEEKRKRGRPKKNVSKIYHVSIRMNDDEMELLNRLCEKSNKNITEVMLNGLRIQENVLAYTDENDVYDDYDDYVEDDYDEYDE